MKLKDKNVVLAGGTGEVGEGMARIFLTEGANVIVPVRSIEKAEKLKTYVSDLNAGTLELIPTKVGIYEEALQFKAEILNKYKKIDIAIASLGGWYMGHDLADMPIEDWLAVMDNNLNAHFTFARTFIPVLRAQNEGIYVNINGGAQDHIMPKAGAMSIISLAQTRMTEVLAKEAIDKNYQVYSVAAYTPVKTRSRGERVQPGWVSAADMGKYIVDLYTNGTKSTNVLHKLTNTL